MKEIKTDVLVIGGGIAGMWSALKAIEKVPSVYVIDKGFVGKTSHSSVSAGVIITVRPQDDFRSCVDDLVQAQDGFIDREVAEFILGNSFERIKDMESWGADYIKDGEEYRAQLSRGAHYLRTIYPATQPGGPLQVVINEALRRGVKILNRIYISDLLTDEDRVTGAIGLEVRTGEVFVIRSKAVVLATNTTGFRGNYLACDMVGDGPMLAYRCGAELINAEFNTINTGPPTFHFEGTGPAAASGARFVNASGEAFMARYYPEDKDRVDVAYLNKAMAMEVREGKDPIYFDLSSVGKEYWDRTWNRKTDLRIHKARLEQWGIDMKKPEWLPAFMNNLGSINVNFNGASKLKGLFAAGKCRGGIGISLMTGWSWCSCVGTGFLAGEAAGIYAKQIDENKIGPEPMKDLQISLFTPLNRDGCITSDRVLKMIQETVFPYDIMIIKQEKRLQKALERIQKIREEVAPEMSARDIHELVRLKETENILLNAEMFLLASIKRTESRYGHFREDFPQRNDANWLQTVVIKRGEDGLIELNQNPS